VPEIVIPPPESLIVVEPEYVCVPLNVRMPAPDFVTDPVPDTTPTYVYALLRSNVRALLFVTSPAIDPVVPPAPTDNVPSLIVVPPV
jgi:hypothetical protein